MPDDLRDQETMLMTLNHDEAIPAWHRRNGEPPRAFEYFSQYLLMPERDLLQLAGELGIKERTLYGYNMKWQWAARAVAYDATKNIVAEAADELLKSRIRQRIYDETTIIRDAFMERVLEMIEGGAAIHVTPYAYEIAHEEGIKTEIAITAKIDMSFFRDVANILATLNRELKGSKDMSVGRVSVEASHTSAFDDLILKALGGGKR